MEEDSSKFVLQIRKPQYWRIELPVADPEDAARAVFLREILDKVLLFEKTSCPFKRSFTVRLPEPPEAPVQKRPWTPRRSLVGPLPTDVPEGSPTPTSNKGFCSSPLRASQSPSRAALDGDDARLKAPEDGGSKGTAESGGSDTTESAADPNAQTGPADTSESDQMSGQLEDAECQPEESQDGATRVETPVKVREVVSVIEERITEDPTPLTAVNEAITQAQQAASLSPTVSPTARSKSPASRNTTPRATVTTTTPTTPLVDSSSSPSSALFKPVDYGRTSEKSEPESDNEGSMKAATTRTVPVTDADADTLPRIPTLNPVDYEQPSVASDAGRVDQGPVRAVASAATRTVPMTDADADTQPRIPTLKSVDRERPLVVSDTRRLDQEPVRTAPTTMTAPFAGTKVSPTIPAFKPVDYGLSSVTARPRKEDQALVLDTFCDTTPPVPEEGLREEPVEEATLSSDGVSNDVHEGAGQGTNILRKRKLRRYGGFSTGRSSTMPPHLTVVTSPPEQPNEKPDQAVDAPSETVNADSGKSRPVSPTESSDSFHSALSPVTPPVHTGPNSPDLERSPQTFPYPHDNIFLPHHAAHHRDISDLTVTPHTRCTWDAMSMSSGASQFSAITAPDQSLAPVEECRKSNASEDGACSSAVSRPAIRHRSTASISTNRALSPLPPAATLFNPKPRTVRRPSTRMEVLKKVPMTIVSKTCEVLLGPPAYLVKIMLRVAARIVAGEWSGAVMGFGDEGETIPVHWDCGELSESEIDELDFVMPEEEGMERFGGGSEDEAGPGWGVD